MTDIPTIAALPPAPQRGQDASVFVQRADAFIDALAAFVAQLNAFGAQLVAATQERVVNEAAGSYAGALAARDAALAARDAAQAYANSINPANLVNLTANQAIAGTKNFTGILQLAGAAITAAATFPEAATADMLANVQSRLVSVRSSWNALVSVALADAATIAVDLSLGINFTVTIAGNRILGNPTNGKPGQTGSVFITQDATGGRVLSYGASYVPDDLVTYPQLNAGAGAVTELRYKVRPDGKVQLYGGKPSGAGYAVTGANGNNMNGTSLGDGYPQFNVAAAGTLDANKSSLVTIYSFSSTCIYNIMRMRAGAATQIGSLTMTAGGEGTAATMSFTTPGVMKNDIIYFVKASGGSSPPYEVRYAFWINT